MRLAGVRVRQGSEWQSAPPVRHTPLRLVQAAQKAHFATRRLPHMPQDSSEYFRVHVENLRASPSPNLRPWPETLCERGSPKGVKRPADGPCLRKSSRACRGGN